MLSLTNKRFDII